ncbi:MAG: hypothetical protein JWP46_4438 [Modestobacter sp.]|jgi:hypothetical protein|nr:hypothetical protein [Modestobacter sp.]
MHPSDETTTVEHDTTHAHQSDEAHDERTPVVRMLANPRRVRRV